MCIGQHLNERALWVIMVMKWKTKFSSKSVYGQLSFSRHLFNYMLHVLGTSF